MNRQEVIKILKQEKGNDKVAMWEELLKMEVELWGEDTSMEEAMFKMTGEPKLRLKLYIMELITLWMDEREMALPMSQTILDADEIQTQYEKFNTKIEKFTDAWLKSKYTGEVE